MQQQWRRCLRCALPLTSTTSRCRPPARLQYFKLQAHPTTCDFLTDTAPVLVFLYTMPAYMLGGSLTMNADYPESVGGSVMNILYAFSPTETPTCLG